MSEKRKRHFSIGDFDIVVTGPADAELKFEHRHNYVQIATAEGELREAGGTVREIVREVARPAAAGATSEYPSVGAPTDHVLSDAALAATTPGAENLTTEQAVAVGQHLRAVADSVGGF